MDRDFRVNLFGRPQMDFAAEKMPAKGFLLLALLVTAPAFQLTRTNAASYLWSSASDSEALVNLRKLLSQLRRIQPVCGNLITTDSSDIRLGVGAEAIDVFRFLKLCRSNDCTDMIEALFLYKAELLLGVEEPTSDFSQWLLMERASLQEQFFCLTETTLVELTRYGRAPKKDLLRLRDHVLAIEPEREASYRIFIDAFGRNGMFNEARNLYDRLVRMLEREHGTGPAAETQTIARRVFSAAPSPFCRAAEPGASDDARLPTVQPRVALLSVSDPAGIADSPIIAALFEDIANELARYRTFTVLAPHSTQVATHSSGIPADNNMLRADYTVSGFVKPDGKSGTLAVRMTNCKNRIIVWSAEYPAGKAELVQTFRTLSAQIASGLAAELEREMLEALKGNPDGKAYWLYLDGQVHLKNCTLPGLRRARKSFREAGRIEPGFALSFGRIAQTLYLEWLLLGGNEPGLLVQARQHADQAAALDPGAAIGFWIGAIVDLYQRSFDRSAEQFTEAETLNPNCADLIVQHADALGHFGMADDGWNKFQRAIDLNPTPPDHYWWAGASIAFFQGNYGRAIDLCAKMGNTDSVVRLLAASHALAGNMPEAHLFAGKIREMYPDHGTDNIRKLIPVKNPDNSEKFIEGLRIAGV